MAGTFESDGPFAKVQGRPSHPEDIPIVYHALAAHWRVPFDKAVEAVTRNFNRITKFTRHSLCSPRKEILPCVTEEMTAFIRF